MWKKKNEVVFDQTTTICMVPEGAEKCLVMCHQQQEKILTTHKPLTEYKAIIMLVQGPEDGTVWFGISELNTTAVKSR